MSTKVPHPDLRTSVISWHLPLLVLTRSSGHPTDYPPDPPTGDTHHTETSPHFQDRHTEGNHRHSNLNTEINHRIEIYHQPLNHHTKISHPPPNPNTEESLLTPCDLLADHDLGPNLPAELSAISLLPGATC